VNALAGIDHFVYVRRMPHALALAGCVILVLGCSKAPDPKLIYVSAEDSGEIVVVDPSSARVQARIPVGKRPRGIKLSRDGKRLFVALSGSPRGGPNVDESQLPPADRKADGVGVVDLVSRKLERTLPSGQDPESFDISRDGKTLYVSNEETAQLSVLDVEAGKLVRQIAVGREPEGVTLRPDGRAVYVTSEQDNTVSAVDTQSLAIIARIPTEQRPRAVVFTADGRLGFVSNELSGSLTVFDGVANTALGVIQLDAKTPVTHRPMGMVLSGDGKRLFVATGRGGAVAVVDVEKRAVERLIEGVGARPWGITSSASGSELFTANGPSHDVSIVDIASGKIERRIEVGGSPWAVISGRAEAVSSLR
jgi:YVTN family beta-propeller protein